jgi:hypothetical protein
MLTRTGLGYLSLVVMFSLLITHYKFYKDGENPNGARAGITFIFLYFELYTVFFNSTLYKIAT